METLEKVIKGLAVTFSEFFNDDHFKLFSQKKNYKNIFEKIYEEKVISIFRM